MGVCVCVCVLEGVGDTLFLGGCQGATERCGGLHNYTHPQHTAGAAERTWQLLTVAKRSQARTDTVLYYNGVMVILSPVSSCVMHF